MSNRITSILSAVATSTIGIIGAFSGSTTLQAVAFLPALGQEIYYTFSNCTADKRIKKDIESILSDTFFDVQESLKNTQYGDFYKYAYNIVDLNRLSINNLNEIESQLLDNIEIKCKAEAVFITEQDIQKIKDLFIDSFSKNLYKYPNLGSFLLSEKLFNHEKRIEALENMYYFGKSLSKRVITKWKDDKEYYCQKYTEALFLHRDLPQKDTISLKDIYISPSAVAEGEWGKRVKRTGYKNIYSNIKIAIKEFIEDKKKNTLDKCYQILFIEGQAAIGKSSLVSWMCWNYFNKPEVSKEIIGEYKLICIKLRDLQRSMQNILNLQQPLLQIYAYLTKTPECELEKEGWTDGVIRIISGSVLVLEGFDELCMLESIQESGKNIYFTNLNNEILRIGCKCKIIITTRPSYLHIEKLNFSSAHITICPFSRGNRIGWFNKYEKKAKVDIETKNYIIDCTDNMEGVLDSPLTIYMIVSQKIDLSNAKGIWEIYCQVFSNEIFFRNYQIGEPHEISRYYDYLYALSAEIANVLSDKRKLSITIESLLELSNIKNLIEKLDGLDSNDDPNYKKIKVLLSDCFGLASYFRVIKKKSTLGKMVIAVEFYHNNIKDYYYCEYIWMNLERIYNNIPTTQHEQEEWFISNFQSLFKYAINLKDNSNGYTSFPMVFFQSKLAYLIRQNNIPSFISQELQKKYFPNFFGKMLQTGMIYEYTYTGKDSILNMMACIFSCVFSIYRSIYVPFLLEGETIKIAKKEYIADISASFIFRILFPMANIHDHSNIDYSGIMFSEMKFRNHNFHNSSFEECLLRYCDFDNCDLSGANLNRASLEYADLSKSLIDEKTRFENAHFKMTKIREGQKGFLSKYIDSFDGDQLIIVE